MGRLALILTLVLGACAEPAPPESGSPSSGPEQTTVNYHTTQTRGGVLEWELWGATAERFPGDAQLHLTEIRMVFYDEGVQSAELTADGGEIDDKTKDTVARGDVVLVNSEGSTLESQVLYWSNKRGIIHTDQEFKYVEDGQILTGRGLETDPDLTNLTIMESPKAEIPASPDNSADRPTQ